MYMYKVIIFHMYFNYKMFLQTYKNALKCTMVMELNSCITLSNDA